MSKYSFVLVVITVIVGAFILGGCPKKPEETSQGGASQSAVVSSGQGASTTSGMKGSGSGEAAEAISSERASLSSEGLGPVYFDFDKSFIRHDAMSVMRANVKWLKAHPGVNITIEGNCDERGTIEYNQALGQRRAVSAKKYLTDMGVSSHRVRLISYGKEKPACSEHSEDCWQKNRRDDFVVVSK